MDTTKTNNSLVQTYQDLKNMLDNEISVSIACPSCISSKGYMEIIHRKDEEIKNACFQVSIKSYIINIKFNFL